MAWRQQRCLQGGPGGVALAELAGFRRRMSGCLWRRADALFELADAVLTAPAARPLPHLSLEPAFRRGHGMVYQGLARGRLDEDGLRDLLVACRPAQWPLAFAIDASAYPRPAAETSPGRAFHHAAGPHGADGAVAGWAFQWLAQLSFDPDSWTAPHDQVRVAAGHGTAEAGQQIIAHAARLRAAGETRIPLYVLDAGYGAADLTWDLRDAPGPVQILVRVRSDRVFYRDAPPRPPGRPGRPRKHGSGADQFRCKDPATWGAPDQELSQHDARYGQVAVASWAGLHPKLYCRRKFAGFAEPPVIRCHLIRVAVGKLPGGRAAPAPLWLWWAGPGDPDLDLCWHAYLHRYDLEHTYRFAKTALGWARPAVRTPDQASRWTWLIITALTQLRLARRIAEDHKLPWEKPSTPGRLTPGRVRRDFPRLLLYTGTPARPPKPARAGPGRPKGRTSTPAPRYPVTRKAA
jgi:hypothetical protein